jgi:hypothetical protein
MSTLEREDSEIRLRIPASQNQLPFGPADPASPGCLRLLGKQNNFPYKGFPYQDQLQLVVLLTSFAFFLWLVYRTWQLAAPPPTEKDGQKPIPSVIKGLYPFSFADGAIFERLGRISELQTGPAVH